MSLADGDPQFLLYIYIIQLKAAGLDLLHVIFRIRFQFEYLKNFNLIFLIIFLTPTQAGLDVVFGSE